MWAFPDIPDCIWLYRRTLRSGVTPGYGNAEERFRCHTGKSVETIRQSPVCHRTRHSPTLPEMGEYSVHNLADKVQFLAPQHMNPPLVGFLFS